MPVPTLVWPPFAPFVRSLAVAWYSVTRPVPDWEGAVNETVAEPSPATAVVPVGAPGGVQGRRGTTLFEGADGFPAPTTLTACTVKLYVLPGVRPVTAQVVAPVVEHVTPPGLDLATYPVIGLPPSLAGAVQLTCADACPAVATAAVGAPGFFGPLAKAGDALTTTPARTTLNTATIVNGSRPSAVRVDPR